MRQIFKWAGIAFISMAAMMTTACNTIQGVGQDIESAGKAIEKAAD